MSALGKTTPIRNPASMGRTSDSEKERAATESKVFTGGEGNTSNEEQRKPTIQFCPNQKVIVQKYINAYITIGNDCPADWYSGYGGIGGTECATIDLCAGAGSGLRDKGKPLTEENVIGRIFAADASRIYISQQTDIDRNFGLPTTHNTDTNGHAAIGIKSDHVRVIGTNSVRLFAGRGVWKPSPGYAGEKNARGEVPGKAGKIEFIAGDVDGLQPVVKGTNLQECIGGVYDHISRIQQILVRFDSAILILRAGLMAHFHAGTPVVDFPSPSLIGGQLQAIPDDITNIVNNTVETMNVELDKSNYLGITPPLQGGGSPLGSAAMDELESLKGGTFILSKTVFST